VGRLFIAFAITLLAAIALRLPRLKELGSGQFVAQSISSHEGAAPLKDYFLEVIARTITNRNTRNESRAGLLKSELVVSVAGPIIAIIAGTIEYFWYGASTAKAAEPALLGEDERPDVDDELIEQTRSGGSKVKS
jgi:hypothetical protein